MKKLSLVLVIIGMLGCSHFRGDEKENGLENDLEESKTQPKITIQVEGVSAEYAQNIRAHLSLATKSCNVSKVYLSSLLKQATPQVQSALAAYGYYNSKSDLDLNTTADCPVLRVHVRELGTPVVVKDVSIGVAGEASEDSAFMAVVKNIKLAKGDHLKHKTYEDAKATIQAVAAERGYFDGRFSVSRLEVNPDAGEARVLLQFDSGARYQIASLDIRQDPELVSTQLVSRFIRVKADDTYSVSAVNDLNNALLQSGYFGSVDVRPELSAKTDHQIPISIDLKPRARHSFSAAAGLSTDEGVRGKLGYLNRRLNEHGHRASIDGKASLISQSGSVEYQIPRENPRAEWLTFQLGARRENVDSFDTVETQGSVTETKLRPFGWLESRYIRLSSQEYDVGSQSEDSVFLIPGIRWARTSTNDGLYPTNGSKYSLELSGASDSILAETSFFSAKASASWIKGMPLRGRLLARTTFGATWVEDFLRLPPSERFFTGGDTTIRGYEFEELGPEDESGDTIGGTYLALASLEYEQRVTEKWSAAVFTDAGNAFGGQGSSNGVRIGVGIGVRWRSPIGPVRADIAHPIDGSQAIRFHLRIGPDL